MKKFFGILAIAGVLVACDNAGNNEQRTKDSLDSVRKADSLSKINSTVDTNTTVTVDTNKTITVDTNKTVTVDTSKH